MRKRGVSKQNKCKLVIAIYWEYKKNFIPTNCVQQMIVENKTNSKKLTLFFLIEKLTFYLSKVKHYKQKSI